MPRLDGFLSAPAVVRTGAVLSGHRLRVLAYHDVRDQQAFGRQLDRLAEDWVPVSGAQVLAAQGGRPLPRRAVWLTFDDAYPDVVELALPLLRAAQVPATLFVCPGVVDTTTPYWWHVVDHARPEDLAALPGGPFPSVVALRVHCKRVPDDVRRQLVRRLAEQQEERAGQAPASPQLTRPQLQQWVDAGLEVGNHTWDHPLLDHCDEEQQRRQVRAAHDWLTDALGRPPDLFAYPNGNVAREAVDELRRLDYRARLLFDHQLAAPGCSEVSRLRLDAFDGLPRFQAVVSGGHPALFQTLQRLRRRGR